LVKLLHIPPERIAPSQNYISWGYLEKLCALSPEAFAREPPTVVKYMGRGAYLAIDGHHHAAAARVRGIHAKVLVLRAGETLSRDSFSSDAAFQRIWPTVIQRSAYLTEFAYETRFGFGIRNLDDLLPPNQRPTGEPIDTFTFLDSTYPWTPSSLLLGG